MHESRRTKQIIVALMAALLLALSIIGVKAQPGDVNVGLGKSQPCWLCGGGY